MWIGICDDNEKFLKEMQRTIRRIAGGYDDLITTYNSGMELIDAVYRTDQPLGLLLLDMKLPGMTGIEYGKELCQLHTKTYIVILTDYMEYAIEGYEIQARDYLIKPPSELKLQQHIRLARVEYGTNQNNNVICIDRKSDTAFLHSIDVLYIKVIEKTVYAFTSQNKHPFDCKTRLRDVAKQLESYGFIRVHQSIIVNMAHVERVNKRERYIRLINGEELPLGNRNIPHITRELLKYRANIWHISES